MLKIFLNFKSENSTIFKNYSKIQHNPNKNPNKWSMEFDKQILKYLSPRQRLLCKFKPGLWL